MQFPANIAKHLRLLFTAITLLFVVGLNNREVTTFAAAPENKTEQKLLESAAAERNGTIKQKVSFEATASYIVLQLAALPEESSRITFAAPFYAILPTSRPTGPVISFIKTFLSTAIQPNAP